MKTTRAEVLAAVNAERVEQDKVWRTGRPNEEQYKFAAPHILLIEEQATKLRSIWYGAKDEGTIRERLVKLAAIAVRALEEIEVTA